MDRRVEHIIKNYQYFELDKTQKDLISNWADNADEFEALQNTLLVTDQFVKSQEKNLNPVIKQRLDVRFAEKYDQKRLVWYNKLWLFLWPDESPFYKRPLIQFAAICLIVVFTIPFFPDVSQQQLAMNDVKSNDKVKNEEKVSTKPEEKTSIENESDDVDEISESELKERSENESRLNDKRSVETIATDQSTSATNQKGWELNEEQAMAGIESRSKKNAQNALDNVTVVTESEESADYFYDKSDLDAIALEEVSMNRSLKDAEAPKKVETKETLDLLTALY